MSCPAHCPREMVSQHEASPGPVHDDERIFRAGYNPMHYNKGKPKNSLIRKSDLLTGTLSFWRVPDPDSDHQKQELQAQLERCPPGQSIGAVYAPTAREVRDISLQDIGRVFSVVDDCEVDGDGGYHPQHCGVRICENVHVTGDEDDMIFALAKAQLFRVLTASSETQPS